MDIIIRKYEKRASVQMVKQNFRILKKFLFQLVSKDEVKNIIKDLKNGKSAGEKFQQKS